MIRESDRERVSELLSSAGYHLNQKDWIASVAYSNLALARMAWYKELASDV